MLTQGARISARGADGGGRSSGVNTNTGRWSERRSKREARSAISVDHHNVSNFFGPILHHALQSFQYRGGVATVRSPAALPRGSGHGGLETKLTAPNSSLTSNCLSVTTRYYNLLHLAQRTRHTRLQWECVA